MRSALALALVVACTQARLDDRSAILPLSELSPAPAGAKPYTPTAKDIQRFRGVLPSTVPPAIAGRAPSYYGQFIGYVDAKGARWIHGNFLCDVHDDDAILKGRWRRAYFAVNDGGPCYFHVEWSPDTNATRALYVNGDA